MKNDFEQECINLVALTILSIADTKSISEKIMLHRGIALLFPKDSEAQSQSSKIAEHLAMAEKQQLKLKDLLK